MKVVSYRKKVVKKESFGQKVKKVLAKTSEAKHHVYSEFKNMNSNVLYDINLLSPIGQGVAVNQRIGDLIDAESIKLNLTYFNATGYDDSHLLRMFIFRNDDYHNDNALTTSYNSSYNNLLTGSTNNSWVNGIVDPKASWVVFDKTFKIKPSYTGSADIFNFSKTISFKRKLQYKSASSEMTKGNWYMGFAVETPNGTSVLTVGHLELTFDLIFKEDIA